MNKNNQIEWVNKRSPRVCVSTFEIVCDGVRQSHPRLALFLGPSTHLSAVAQKSQPQQQEIVSVQIAENIFSLQKTPKNYCSEFTNPVFLTINK